MFFSRVNGKCQVNCIIIVFCSCVFLCNKPGQTTNFKIEYTEICILETANKR